MSKYLYRFKTEEEFIKEFGTMWREYAFPNIGWCEYMDKFLGKDFELITKDNLYKFENKKDFVKITNKDYNGQWTIIWRMIKLKNNIPTYLPRKLSYE
jgi:hypothetical protein